MPDSEIPVSNDVRSNPISLNPRPILDSAYTIASGDISNAPIVSPPLNDKHYYSWSRAMLMAIGARNKFGFLNGSIPALAPTDSNFNAWYRCNLMVSSWICASPESAQVILYIDSTEKMWKLLKERYEQSNEPRIFELQQSLSCISQGQSSVSDYFT